MKKIVEPIKLLGAKDGLKYIFLEGTSALKKFLPILGKVSVGLGGLVTTIVGTKGVYDSMKKMTKETEYGGEEYKKYTASVLATTGGATALGAVLGGPLGAAIGALTGTVISGTSAFFGYKQGIKADVVVVDPPRSGCDGKLIDMLNNMKPKKIVYVSCNSATLARDVSMFEGYKVEKAQPVDMFPWTYHVETVIMMQNSRK